MPSHGGRVYEGHEHLCVIAAEIAADIGPEGPFLDGCDVLIAAVGRKLGAPVVSADDDLMHAETKTVLDVIEYRA